MLTLNPNKFEPLGPTSWPAVFAGWQADEENQAGWQKLWQSKGFHNWEDWRANHVEPFKCAQREWHLYRLLNPLASIPNFYAGPHKAWIKRYYNGEKMQTFGWLVTHTDIPQRASTPSDKIHDLVNGFPPTTTLIGFQADQDIVILEGMHRSCALAVVAARKQPFSGEIKLAISDLRDEQLPIVGIG